MFKEHITEKQEIKKNVGRIQTQDLRIAKERLRRHCRAKSTRIAFALESSLEGKKVMKKFLWLFVQNNLSDLRKYFWGSSKLKNSKFRQRSKLENVGLVPKPEAEFVKKSNIQKLKFSNLSELKVC